MSYSVKIWSTPRSTIVAEWEAEIKVRRNGRLVKMERALGSTAETALYNAHNDVELWAQAQKEGISDE